MSVFIGNSIKITQKHHIFIYRVILLGRFKISWEHKRTPWRAVTACMTENALEADL